MKILEDVAYSFWVVCQAKEDYVRPCVKTQDLSTVQNPRFLELVFMFMPCCTMLCTMFSHEIQGNQLLNVKNGSWVESEIVYFFLFSQ